MNKRDRMRRVAFYWLAFMAAFPFLLMSAVLLWKAAGPVLP